MGRERNCNKSVINTCVYISHINNNNNNDNFYKGLISCGYKKNVWSFLFHLKLEKNEMDFFLENVERND